MDYEIIDFHTHPYLRDESNICNHKDVVKMTPETTLHTMKNLGISKFCGSVIQWGKPEKGNVWDKIARNNQDELILEKQYNGAYVPGLTINPDYVEESEKVLEFMKEKGYKLVGELVPYFDDWENNYASDRFSHLLDICGKYGFVVSFHSMDEDAMDIMVKKHPDVTFVAAHPGEYGEFCRHMKRSEFSENYYLDVSGYGIFRHGMLRHAIDVMGKNRILFGSDYPTCSPAMYVGGVVLDDLISDDEKRCILSENAKRILEIK